MTDEQKAVALKEANDRLRELSSGDIEWSYAIFAVTKSDGSNSIVVTNFKSDGYNLEVTINEDFPEKNEKAFNVIGNDLVGEGHSHGLTNGDHSAQDLQSMYFRARGLGENPRNGYTSVVVGRESNYYITVENGYLFRSQYNSSLTPTIGQGAYGDYYIGWHHPVGGRDNAHNWGLRYYDQGNFYKK